MQIFCGYSQDGLRAETQESISKYAPGAQLRYLDGVWSYWEMLVDIWRGEEDLVLIEQDMVITEDVIPSFHKCSAYWCSFAYECFVAKPVAHVGRLSIGLGCTKFSAQLQRDYPLDPLRKIQWPDVDSTIVTPLVYGGGYEPHDHGDVEHLHDYTRARNLFRAFGVWNEA